MTENKISLTTDLTYKMLLTFWWDLSEGLQCSFVSPSNVRGIYWILKSGWTVRNHCTKSKSFPEKADQSWNPLIIQAVIPHYFQIHPFINFWQKNVLCQSKWITNISFFQNLRNSSTFPPSTFIKRKKWWQPSYLRSIASSGLMPCTSIKYLTKQHNSSYLYTWKEKNQVFSKEVQFHLQIDIKILKKH